VSLFVLNPEIIDRGPDFKLSCDGRTSGCHGNVAKEKMTHIGN
jgi:hypothetical protein